MLNNTNEQQSWNFSVQANQFVRTNISNNVCRKLHTHEVCWEILRGNELNIMLVEKKCEAVEKAMTIFGNVDAFKTAQYSSHEQSLMLKLLSFLKHFLAFDCLERLDAGIIVKLKFRGNNSNQ